MTTSSVTLQSLLQKASEVKLDQIDVLQDSDSPISQVADLILEAAIHSGTSAVHIEPRNDFVQVRYRIDGMLRNIRKLPHNLFAGIVARIKVLAELKIDEQYLPQYGRFELTVDDKRYLCHVSTLPVTDGEKMVLNICDESSHELSFEALGYWGQGLSALHHAILQPRGLVLISGMIGSGTTTNIYSALHMLNRPTVNIASIEDPIAYRLPGVNQTQVNSRLGITFANGLQAILRQDPDILMLGDLRDSETARMGIQVAASGRLVLAAMHASSAALTLDSMLAMGVEPFLLAATTQAVINRRLARRLCERCREPYKPASEEVIRIFANFNVKTKRQLHVIHDLELQAEKEGIGRKIKDYALVDNNILRLYKAHPGGCEACAHSGYKGQIGFCEVLLMSTDMSRLIMAHVAPSALQEQAVAEGMVTLGMDALIKVLRGETSVEESLRILQG